MTEEPEISQALLRANPHIAVVLFLFVALVLLVIASFFSLWGTALVRLYHGQPILTVKPWRPRVWGLIDVLLVLAAALFGQAIMIPIWGKLSGLNLREMVENDSVSLSVMAVGSFSYLVAMLLGVCWLFLRHGAGFRHMGLSFKSWLPNLGLGLAAAAMTLPIVAVISAAVTQGLKTEYDHPLINELKKEGTVSAYLLAVFSAVVVAPLVEEFFFRVLLQGWLESVPWSWRGWWWLLGKGQPETALEVSAPTAELNSVVDASAVSVSAATDGSQVTAVGQVSAGSPLGEIAVEPPIVNRMALEPMSVTTTEPYTPIVLGQPPVASDAIPPVWPSFVVGTLFGLAHFDYGLSYIPLIVLGTVLGLLYRAKHSIWPCFILHFALNSFSMASLGIALLVSAAK